MHIPVVVDTHSHPKTFQSPNRFSIFIEEETGNNNSNEVRDIKRFCCKESGSVLCIDKTFNLGEFHVTPTVYKDLSVARLRTDDHPLCFGPT